MPPETEGTVITAGSSGGGEPAPAGVTAGSSAGGAAPPSTGAAAPSSGAASASTVSSSGATLASTAIASGSTVSSSGGAVDITWPDGWREQVAKGDAKALARMQRYASPAAALEALSALQAKISAGELRAVPKKDATPEEVAAYRAAQGIPEKPEAYQLALPEGLQVGAEDKPLIDGYLANVAHKQGLTNEQASENVAWYYAMLEEQNAQIAARDKADAQKAQDTLRTEWGADYRANMNLIHGMLDLAPPGVKEKMLGKRMEDGKGFANDPEVLRWLAGIGRELNPAGAVAPGTGAAASSAIDTEIEAIEKLMKADSPDYWKGDTGQRNQARLRELYEARDKLKARG